MTFTTTKEKTNNKWKKQIWNGKQWRWRWRWWWWWGRWWMIMMGVFVSIFIKCSLNEFKFRSVIPVMFLLFFVICFYLFEFCRVHDNGIFFVRCMRLMRWEWWMKIEEPCGRNLLIINDQFWQVLCGFVWMRMCMCVEYCIWVFVYFTIIIFKFGVQSITNGLSRHRFTLCYF